MAGRGGSAADLFVRGEGAALLSSRLPDTDRAGILVQVGLRLQKGLQLMYSPFGLVLPSGRENKRLHLLGGAPSSLDLVPRSMTDNTVTVN